MLSFEQLRMRQTGITASDIVRILGQNPWASAANVYEDKLRSVAELRDNASTMSNQAWTGHMFEEALSQRYLADMSEPLQAFNAKRTFRAPDCEWALATPDRFIFAGPELSTQARIDDGHPADWLLECKLVGTRAAAAWDMGDDTADIDRIPAYVYTQTQWQMRVLGYDRCDVSALLYGTTFLRATVLRDDEYIEAMQEVAERFWFDNVLAKRPPAPDGTEAYSHFLRRRFAMPSDSSMVEAPAGAEALVKQYALYRKIEKDAYKQKQKAGQALMAAIGPASGFEGPWGSVKWVPKRGRVSVTLLAEKQSIAKDVLDACRKPMERTLYVRVTGAKEEDF